MESQKLYSINAVNLPPAAPKRTVRKHLNADTLFERVREDFQKVPDTRADNATISLDDALMSALAIFQLTSPVSLSFQAGPTEQRF